MKKSLFLVSLLVFLTACHEKQPDVVVLDDAFAIEQPVPQKAITRVSLDDTQNGYVREGNKMSFKLLQQLTRETSGSFVCSPLSLQLALAMTVNGAEGETAEEMLNVLGYGRDGRTALNAYARILIEQLPALDLDVTIKVADALLTTDAYPLNAAFRETLRTFYYAPAASMSFEDPTSVLAQINEWARRNTEGLIDPILKDMNPNAVAFLLNALYFKAKWQGRELDPMFNSDATYDDTFYRADGSTGKRPFMSSARVFPYADLGDFEMVALPYASGKFFLYILLPKKRDGLDALVQSLTTASWNNLISSLHSEDEIRLRLPKFDVSGNFELKDALQAMGIRRAFDETAAEFGGMFDVPCSDFYISRVIQKAKMTVAEWGTEAAAVTVVEMAERSALPGKAIPFVADHPFVFVLGEHDTGTILFEGIYLGE